MEKGVSRLTLSSFIASLLLSLMKLYAGIVTNSLSVMAEFLHSSLDSLTTLITLLTVRFSMRPPDSTHPYGHRKIDSIGGLAGSVLLILTMVWVMDEAVRRIFNPPEIEVGALPIAVMLVSIFVDLERSRALKRAAKLTGSRALEADSLHFSSDIFTSLIVIFGLLFMKIGIKLLDPLMGVMISLLFLRSAIKIAKESIYDLTDRIDPEIIERIRRICLETPGVEEVERIRARKVGNFLFVDLKVRSLRSSGELSERIAEALKRELGVDVDLVMENLSEENLEERVRKISLGVEGVLDVHAVSFSEEGRKVSLHAVVDPDMEAWRAHEISDELERKLKEELPGVIEAVVHVDPADLPSLTFSREEMRDLIMRKIEKILREAGSEIEELDVSDSPWTVTLRVIVSREAGLREVHEFTHKLELAIRELIPSASVTVHFSTP